jgi:hypothetical protein
MQPHTGQVSKQFGKLQDYLIPYLIRSASNAWIQNFYSDTQNDYGKPSTAKVRAVRAF